MILRYKSALALLLPASIDDNVMIAVQPAPRVIRRPVTLCIAISNSLLAT
jgi:hypothetical protein